jgi:hypothetical protein
MRLDRLGFEFGMELTAQKPRVIFELYDFDQLVLEIYARDLESGIL